MSGLKPRRRSSSLTTWRSAESSGSSVLSTTGGVGGGATSVGAAGAGAGGAGTVVVSTLRSGGGVFGFFLGQPTIKINSAGTTIQAISFRFMLSLLDSSSCCLSIQMPLYQILRDSASLFRIAIHHHSGGAPCDQSAMSLLPSVVRGCSLLPSSSMT